VCISVPCVGPTATGLYVAHKYSKFSMHAMRARRLGEGCMEGCPTHRRVRRAPCASLHSRSTSSGARPTVLVGRDSSPDSADVTSTGVNRRGRCGNGVMMLEARRSASHSLQDSPRRQCWARSVAHGAPSPDLPQSPDYSCSMHCPCERQRPARFARSVRSLGSLTRRSRRRAGRAAPRRSG